jgi:predicted MFS family arabinose efflux permease
MMDTSPPHSLRRMPTGIWVLGVVSLLMDISSEMIHSLLPLFMVTTLGAGTIAVGIVEGLAESLALVVKVFSGTLSDYLRRRKGLALFGYALGALTKPLFAIAPDIGTLLTARLLDRVGKGVRGAPPRCVGGGHRAGASPRRSVRLAAIARYGGGLSRPPCSRSD